MSLILFTAWFLERGVQFCGLHLFIPYLPCNTQQLHPSPEIALSDIVNDLMTKSNRMIAAFLLPDFITALGIFSHFEM